ncbi:E3 ubiquitin-protein ligase TRIM56-like [Apostichopus japonicus]|uniref:E3 ubiquitin-protein ligase TRIM56-like n=1 Tax=Stichopus japonicus TaxID=307972 RepID=UPI003AB83859
MASNTTSMIDEILSCPICSDVLDAPKILQCLHRFCTKCLEDTLRYQNPFEGSFQCPICRQDTELPPDGVEGIKNDFVIEAILEKLKLEQELKQKKKERSCSSCDEIMLSAEAFCADCGGLVCKECYQPHKTMKSLRNHMILLEDLQSENVSKYVDKFTPIHKTPKCDQHADQILYFNCMTCSTLICPVCAPVSHKSHAIEEVATTFVNILKQLVELCNISSENDKKLRILLQLLDLIYARIETEAERCFDEIRSDTSKAETKITSEKEVLIAKIEGKAKKGLEHVRHHNNDAVNTVKVRKETCLTYLNEMRSKLYR